MLGSVKVALQGGHHAEHDQQVHDDREEGDDAGQVVITDQEHAHDGHANEARHQPVNEIAAAQLRLDVPLADRLFLKLGRQAAGAEGVHQVIEIRLAESFRAAVDLAVGGDHAADDRGVDDLAVENHRQRLADVGPGQFSEVRGALRIEGESDDLLARSAI